MKSVKFISIIAFILIIFLGGYFTNSMVNNEPSREIRIGFQNSENSNRIDYTKTFKSTKNQAIIDNFLMIYLQKEKIENVNLDVEPPDIYISVVSPKQSVGLINSRLWFTNNGAIIAERSGDSWNHAEFYKINKGDASYIEGIIDE